jgi:hypothetical protein
VGLLARLFALVSFVGSILIGVGLALTFQTRRSPKQHEFVTGRVPSELPDGFYDGSADLKTSWRGKTFNAVERRGINRLESGGTRRERFPFGIYFGSGLTDPQIEVLKIDYDIPENPFWLRWILDEMVEVADGSLLGKVHVRLVPGFPFTVGYFRLAKTRASSTGGPSSDEAVAGTVPSEA